MTKREPQPKSIRFSLDMEPALHEQIKQAAKKERRKMRELVLFAVERYLEKVA